MSLPDLVVEIAFRTNPDATIPEWEDVSADVISFSVRRGRQRELDVVQAGVADIRLKNGDRRYDPAYSYSPFHPYVLPMRKVRVSAVWNSTTYYLFTGYVERWPLTWEAPQWGSVTITAVDGMAALAQADLADTLEQELSGSRIDRVLSAGTWPESTPQTGGYWTLGTSALDTTTILSYALSTAVLDTGMTTVAEEVIPEGGGLSALTHIQAVTQAERGVFFISGNGTAVFHDRHHRFGTASTVTFTDGSTSATRLPYQELEPTFDVDRLINEAIVTRPGGTPQSATDANSREKYFRRTLSLTLPLVTDAEAASRAEYEVTLRSEPHLEFTRLAVKPQADAATWPYALGLDIGDRVTVERTPGSFDPIPVETIIQDCFVESVAHQVTPSEWVTAWQLSPADDYDQFFVLGTSALDISTALGY